MKIWLTNAGKRFNRDWIFRRLSYQFLPGHSYAITGPNGSGKSTLLQSIAGAIAISEGSIGYAAAPLSAAVLPASDPGAAIQAVPPDFPIPSDQAYQHLSLAAPYLDVIEEMTVSEFLRFHASFKPLLTGLSVSDVIDQVGLAAAANRQIRFYSSGMKQRVRLAQALFSNTSTILLDEPCTNLDVDGIALYRRLMGQYAKDRTVIVSSNDLQEYDFCEESINILDYK